MAKILLVDDSEMLLQLTRSFLERKGYEVSVARDGDEAFRLMKLQPFDLLITDLVMPGREGIELIQWVRKSFSQVPILAISGGGRNQPSLYLDLARKLGAHLTLPKPFSGEQLCNCARVLLNSRPSDPAAKN